jgi:mannose-6-phosphate isomerase
MNVDRLYRLTCGVARNDWGDPGTGGRPPLIAELRHEAADGRPYAELWVGAHPTLPAVVEDWPGRPSLAALLRAQAGPFLGATGSGVGCLPFLLKVLSCVQPLSIQAHPDRGLAARLHAADPEHYPDANHKPELAVALTPFAALAGFRAAEEVQAEIEGVPPLRAFFGAVPGGPDWLRQAFTRIFRAVPGLAEAAVAETRSYLTGRADISPQAQTFLVCEQYHPRDPGALAALFLNLMHLEPGEALFVAPNEPHAYLEGDIIECMAASDNVVRAGLTRRWIDRDTLLAMLTYRAAEPALIQGTADGPGVWRYTVPADEFELEFRGADGSAAVRSEQRLSLMLVLDGEFRLSTGQWHGVAQRGSAWVWPAAVPVLQVEATGASSRWVRAFPARASGQP